MAFILEQTSKAKSTPDSKMISLSFVFQGWHKGILVLLPLESNAINEDHVERHGSFSSSMEQYLSIILMLEQYGTSAFDGLIQKTFHLLLHSN